MLHLRGKALNTVISKVENPSEAEEQKFFWDSWFKLRFMEFHNLMESKNPDIISYLLLYYIFDGVVVLAFREQ